MTSLRSALYLVLVGTASAGALSAQAIGPDTRDPAQKQDSSFARSYREWLPNLRLGSPLVDHLPLVDGIPTPRDILGYHVGAPRKLTYYADQLRYYRALAAATPRVRVESLGKSDEGRELVVVWVSSEENMAAMAGNRRNLGRLADPRGLSPTQVAELIGSTKPHYHLMGGLHSGETGPSEMLMELVYRLATETSPIISRIRNNLYVSVTPVADADGRDRNVDWFYRNMELGLDKPLPAARDSAARRDSAATPARRDSAAGQVQRDSAASPARRDSAAGGARRDTSATRRDSAATPAAPAPQSTAPQSTAPSATGTPSRVVPSVPYWGRYAYHDNNRDINLVLVQMRAIADWYFTAHPPIMHDLHESLPLLYTYSGAAPQNPNLDPLLFAELPWFANWELSQMTRFGMPGVYTHAFMDGWSPGYLGSISYNHNGLMKMYETQSGRDLDTAQTRARADSAARTPATTTTAAGGQGGGPGGAGRGGLVPTGRGGAQDREWYRGIPIGRDDSAKFTRRANANYMQTGVLSSLQLASMFPATVLENFYVRTRNSIEEGRTKAPYGYLIPVQRDMTRAAELVNILRVQRIEIGVTTEPVKLDSVTYPAGAYLIKRDQPYGRLAKNLLEKQQFPDARLTTYDDSGWTMGLAMMVDVVEVADSSILSARTTPVTTAAVKGELTGSGSAGIAVAHLGSNNMISFRYRLRSVPMRIAEKSFSAEGMEFPAGSFVISGSGQRAAVRAAVEELGLRGAQLSALPAVPMHNAELPRIAIYTQWTGTQNLGWYRLTFDKFGIPFELIYKEQVELGNLRAKYDVILAAEQNLSRQTVLAVPGARPVPYQKSDKYQFLGMYGESAYITGGFRQKGVDAFASFLEGGGTLITVGDAARMPIEFGWAGTVEKAAVPGLTAQRPLVQGEIVRPEHPVFYGYGSKTIPIKYVGGQPFRVGLANEDNVLARYVGGNASVLSGLMVGADSLRQKPFAVDIPRARHGNGRVILFSNNPIYRWQNHGEFNMIFNALLNWNDVVAAPPKP
jgi:8-oxo-dGTP pyrophosphatase MutT (NUDIX family)